MLGTFAHEAVLLRSGSTTFRALLVRVLLGSLACILVVGAVCHRSLKHMWRHLRDQSTWVGDQYGGSASRFDVAYFESYVHSLFASFSWLWLFVIGAISVLAIVDRTRRGARADDRTSTLMASESRTERSPVAQGTMLAFAVSVNFAGCYFFPVTDVRFAIGAMIAAVLLLGLLAAWAVRRDSLRDVLGFVMLVVFGSWLLVNTHASSAERTLLALPWHFEDPGPVHPPRVDPDLRDAALDAIGVESRRVALAGDHASFNIDNLRLRMLERGWSHELEQVGYLAPKIELADALSRLDEPRLVEFFLVCRPPQANPSSLWKTQLGEPFFEALSASEDWVELPRIGSLRDGSEVVLFERTHKSMKSTK
ncbi:MAG: hypothetical protein KDC95_03645 [Planctomycetes bacterium]|nr:hypothetical protein [Planctomycetota bacterium]